MQNLSSHDAGHSCVDLLFFVQPKLKRHRAAVGVLFWSYWLCTYLITPAQNLIHSPVMTDKSIYMPTYHFATMIAPYERKRERSVELVGLGLPLQGSEWTEYSMHMWRRVCERRHCVRVAPEPLKKKKKKFLCMFLVTLLGLLSYRVIKITISERKYAITFKTRQHHLRKGSKVFQCIHLFKCFDIAFKRKLRLSFFTEFTNAWGKVDDMSFLNMPLWWIQHWITTTPF